jgi:hypothetical protein
VRYWERYEELAKKLEGASFTAALHAAVARVVRDYLPAGSPASGSNASQAGGAAASES